MKPDLANGTALRFGVFELDLGNRELRRNGLLIALQPQPFNLLALLASQPDRLVTREEIRRELWPDEQAGDFDARLNFYVRKIREALDDDADRPRYIKTHRKFGYTLIAPVARSKGDLPAALNDTAPELVLKGTDGRATSNGGVGQETGAIP